VIPEFPRFKSLELDDREEIETFVGAFPPYSDFNFVSLFCYDARNQFKIAFLNGNLVVKMIDYVTREPFYTFLGNSEVITTAQKLLRHAKDDGTLPVLKLVPECTVAAARLQLTEDTEAREDPDSFDYIYDAEQTGRCIGPHYSCRRYQCKRFERDYPDHRFVNIDLRDRRSCRDILQLLGLWQQQKRRSPEDVEVEFEAIEKCLRHGDELQLHALGLVAHDVLIGFTIWEPLMDSFVMCHFAKANPSFEFASDALKRQWGRAVVEQGAKFINYQQDLGIPGLRRHKQAWRPMRFLKKFTLKPRDAM